MELDRLHNLLPLGIDFTESVSNRRMNSFTSRSGFWNCLFRSAAACPFFCSCETADLSTQQSKMTNSIACVMKRHVGLLAFLDLRKHRNPDHQSQRIQVENSTSYVPSGWPFSSTL